LFEQVESGFEDVAAFVEVAFVSDRACERTSSVSVGEGVFSKVRLPGRASLVAADR
jgi:hypothetical protein